MKSNTIFGIILLGFVLYILYSKYNSIEHFDTPESNVPESNTSNEIPEAVAPSSAIPTPVITEYTTQDGGVSIKWNKPYDVVDYMALIKDEDGDEVKMFFKDTLSAECDTDTCGYSFQNLSNGNQYSIALACVTSEGIGNFSNKIFFKPTFRTMKCNANGTCSVINMNVDASLQAKMEQILSNDDVSKEVMAKCHGLLSSDKNINDINKIYQADGQFKLVKDELQYPEHLLLPIKKGPNSLAELIKHQLEQGIINVNVHTEGSVASSNGTTETPQ